MSDRWVAVRDMTLGGRDAEGQRTEVKVKAGDLIPDDIDWPMLEPATRAIYMTPYKDSGKPGRTPKSVALTSSKVSVIPDHQVTAVAAGVDTGEGVAPGQPAPKSGTTVDYDDLVADAANSNDTFTQFSAA